jgi:hypothetical protein
MKPASPEWTLSPKINHSSAGHAPYRLLSEVPELGYGEQSEVYSNLVLWYTVYKTKKILAKHVK